jgi:hypothetical protein
VRSTPNQKGGQEKEFAIVRKDVVRGIAIFINQFILTKEQKMKRLLLFAAVLIVVFMGNAFAQFAITIDAEKDAYYNTLTGPDDGYIYIGPEAAAAPEASFPENPPRDAADLSAHVWLAYDEEYLYTYFEVKDDIILVNNTTVHQNDAVEFKIDPNTAVQTSGNPANCRLSALGENDADEVLGVDYPGKDSNLGDPWTSTEGEDYARKLTDDGYALEWRLPWAVIHIGDEYADVVAGSAFGLGINIMDNDATQRTKDIQWSAGMHDNIWSTQNLLGTVTFLPDHKLKMEPFNSIGGPDPVSDPNWYIPAGTDVAEKAGNAPSSYALLQNYPNPFNPSTTIEFSLPKSSKVVLAVYDVTGNEVANLVNGVQTAGIHRVTFNGANMTSGIYFCRLETENKVFTKKLTLIK